MKVTRVAKNVQRRGLMLKRYDFDSPVGCMRGSKDGEWVRWEDVAAVYGAIKELMAHPNHVRLVYIPEHIKMEFIKFLGWLDNEAV